MDNNKDKTIDEITAFGQWYHKWIARIIPEYAFFSVLFCGLFNLIIYFGIQFLVADRVHYDLTSALDRKIPFVRQWVIIYLGCYVFWIANYILITKEGKEKWFRFATADYMSRIVCGICFVLIPTTICRPEVLGHDFSSLCMQFVYSADKPVNLFPSVHCLVSAFCYIGIRGSKKVPVWYQRFSVVFAICIFLSTQFTKQHYSIDVAGGVLLAEICAGLNRHYDWYQFILRIFDALSKRVFGREYV